MSPSLLARGWPLRMPQNALHLHGQSSCHLLPTEPEVISPQSPELGSMLLLVGHRAAPVKAD